MSAAAVRAKPAPKPRTKAKGRAKPKGRAKRTLTDRLVDVLPISREAASRLAGWSVLAIAGLLIVAILMLAGVHRFVGRELAEVGGRAGLTVRQFEVTGLSRMNSLDVYSQIATEEGTPILLVDLDAVRDSLLGHGWVADARVSRRLPDLLAVDIVERVPVAVWDRAGRLALIDKTGAVIETVDASAMPDLPLVQGPGANRRVEGLARLMSAAPAVAERVAGAAWRGNRRWDVRFQSGEVLALPEGEDVAREALRTFATIDGTQGLLERGFVRFDMRDPTRIVNQLPPEGSLADTPGKAGGTASTGADAKRPG